MAISTVKATVNGSQYNLTYNSTSGKYEATLTAPSTSSYTKSGHYYNVSVTAVDTANNTATVDAAHATLGNSLRLVVKEKVKPTVAITSPGAGARLTSSKPTITAQLRDNDSGVDIATLALRVDGGAAVGSASSGMTCTPVSGGYNIAYVPPTALGEGAHTVSVSVSDNDANASAAASVSFTVDTIAPTLNVTAPAEGLVTNQTAGSVVGSTNDTTSSPCTLTIAVNGVSAGNVTLTSGSFNHSVSYREGENTIVVTSTDAAGLSTSVTRHITVNTTAPKFKSVELIPNPVDCGQTYVIKVSVE